MAERDLRLTAKANFWTKDPKSARVKGEIELADWYAAHAKQLLNEVEYMYSLFKDFSETFT
jgi:hypothetical protein